METQRKKIFPRNLTARASARVRGNPDSSRPESGVDNSYPGLEFDQRNLDKKFFSNLYFEFHRKDGAILSSLERGNVLEKYGVSVTGNTYFLWAVIGYSFIDTKNPEKRESTFFNFQGLEGLDVWRRIHDLLPGKVALLLGNHPLGFSNASLGEAHEKLEFCFKEEQPFFLKYSDEEIKWFIIQGERSEYLDKHGVILPDSFPSGELTRSLCAPWQYDFRDCGCFYWAANKPDMVGHEKDPAKYYLNYMRKDRSDEENNPDIITRYYPDIYPNEGKSDTWTSREYNYAEFIKNWRNLPIILNDKESDGTLKYEAVDSKDLMDKQAIIEELTYLTGVEHALTVKYLYAHYSVNSPLELESDSSVEQKSIHAAADEVFKIAVDEMRHFRWVNECLNLIGEPTSVERATVIGRKLEIPYSLDLFTKSELEKYIEIEKPSQSVNSPDGSIDGMYVKILESIEEQPDLFGEKTPRLLHLIKLIIDEGEDHYQRFLSIKDYLSGIDEKDYLRDFRKPESEKEKAMYDLCDINYEALLDSLQIAFNLGDSNSGQFVRQSVRAMHNLHYTAHLLASMGVGIDFNLPVSDSDTSSIRRSTPNTKVNVIQIIEGIDSKISNQLYHLRSLELEDHEAQLTFQIEAEKDDFIYNMKNIVAGDLDD